MTDTNENTTNDNTNEPTIEAREQAAATEATIEASESRREGDPRVERTVEAAGRIVEAAVDIGRAWAAYGLRVGKLALETHAHTMGKLAGALGEIDRTIESRHESAAPQRDDATPAT